MASAPEISFHAWTTFTYQSSPASLAKYDSVSSESSTGDEATALLRPARSDSLKPLEGFGSYSSLSTDGTVAVSYTHLTLPTKA